jgi:hypothetical protein
MHWPAFLTMPSTSEPQGGLEGALRSAGGPRQGGVVKLLKDTAIRTGCACGPVALIP